MSSRNWVENTVWGIIILNFIVLMYVFLIPRTQFMAEHWGNKPESLMETSGAMDTPNQYSSSYKMANQILKMVRRDSVVVMPPENRKIKFSRSVLIQRLYPRKVYFFGDLELGKLPSLQENRGVYVVFNEDWGKTICEKSPIVPLSNKVFGICFLKNGSPSSLIDLF